MSTSGATPECTCYRPWMSILPPPPCPAHSGPWWQSPFGATTVYRVCVGRHCAHDHQCNRWIGVAFQ